MSFTTRCPACGTTFRIVADQLKISEGWVRCGHCADVFDATLYLEPWAPAAPASAPAPDDAAASPTPAPPMPAPAPARAELTNASDVRDEELITRPPAPWPVEPPAASPDEPDFSTELQKFAATKAAAEALTAVAPATVSTTPIKSAANHPGRSDPPSRDSVDPEAVPGFVRQAQKRAFWQSLSVRIGLSFLALLLGAVLAVQWALHERDRIAAWRPDLLPVLEQVCAPMGCVVAPVRNIDAIVIDSSALVRRLGNFHSFDLVLKNNAAMALALPALELSLTDTRDEVISRRVFLPEEWPDAPALIPAQGSLNVSFRLSLSVGESTPMAGYRALLFYP